MLVAKTVNTLFLFVVKQKHLHLDLKKNIVFFVRFGQNFDGVFTKQFCEKNSI